MHKVEAGGGGRSPTQSSAITGRCGRRASHVGELQSLGGQGRLVVENLRVPELAPEVLSKGEFLCVS